MTQESLPATDVYARQLVGRSLADALLLRAGGLGLRALPRLPTFASFAILRALQRMFRPGGSIATELVVTRRRYGRAQVYLLTPPFADPGTVVYIHGGAYIFGAVGPQWEWAAEIARQTRRTVAFVSYPMPPDHPFPSALDAAEEAIVGLVRDRDGRWVLAGDSAGGGLAIAVLRSLLARGLRPAGCVLTAPWVDIAMDNPALDESQQSDPLLARGWLGWAARLYADGVPLDDPRVSPINGDFEGFPPFHLNVGDRDLFLPDVVRLRDALRHTGVHVRYIQQAGGIHAFALLVRTPEGRRATADQAAWMSNRLGSRPEPGAMLGVGRVMDPARAARAADPPIPA